MTMENGSPYDGKETPFYNTAKLEHEGIDNPTDASVGSGVSEREEQPVNNINSIVEEIQREDGIDVGEDWWRINVGDKGTEQEMLEKFREAYERDFPRGEDGQRHPRHVQWRAA